MKVVLMMLLFTHMASAAIVKCEYQEKPCDAEDNHFYCNVFGWTDQHFCSATDRTTKFSRQSLELHEEKDCSGHCWRDGCCPDVEELNEE